MKRTRWNECVGTRSGKLFCIAFVVSIAIQLGCNAKVKVTQNEADGTTVVHGQVTEESFSIDKEPASKVVDIPVIDLPVDTAIEAEVNELSEADLTIDNKLLPKDRPDWVAAADSYDGDVHTLVITTPTGNSEKECNEKFPEVAYQRFVVYAKEKMNIDLKMLPAVTKDWVASRTLSEKDRFYVDRSVDGVLTYSGWSKMQIGPETRAEVFDLHRQSRWFVRSTAVGTLFVGMVLLFGVLHISFHLITGKQPQG